MNQDNVGGLTPSDKAGTRLELCQMECDSLWKQRNILLAICEEIAQDSRCDLVTSERRVRLYKAVTECGGYIDASEKAKHGILPVADLNARKDGGK